MMSEDVNMPLESAAPLPWYPPTCRRYDGSIPRYDSLRTIDQWTYIQVRKQEKEIEEAFDHYSAEKNFHEWGARVHQAMKIV